MNLIERLLKNKEPDEYTCFSNKNYKADSWNDNFSKLPTHKYATPWYLEQKHFSNYILLNLTNKQRRMAKNISNVNGFVFDFDEAKGGYSIDELIARLKGVIGLPTFEYQTTPSKNKTQLLYLFKNREERCELAEMISQKLVHWSLADPSVFDLPRVVRNPYSFNGKSQERCKMLASDGPEYDLDSIIKIMEQEGIDTPDESSISSIVAPKATNTTKKATVKTYATRYGKRGSSVIDNKAEDIDIYNEFLLLTNNNPSDARYRTVCHYVGKRMPDAVILKKCLSLGFDKVDSLACIDKIRGRA